MIDTTIRIDPDLPFTVEPPSAKQMRFWAKFGEQAANANDMNVMRDVYSACMWQCYAVENFVTIQSLLAGDLQEVHLALGWFDMLVADLRWVSDGWVRVVTVFQQQELPGKRWERDAVSHMEETQALLTQVCAFVFTFSIQFGFPLSERLQHACAAVLPGWIPQQTSSPLQQ